MSGSIRFDGRELVGLPDDAMCKLRGDRIGMVFQEPMTALNPLHTRRPPDRRAAAPASRPECRRRARARRCDCSSACRCPMRARGSTPIRTSCRAASASASASRWRWPAGPTLLIADEPTTALDVTIQREVLKLIAELVAEDEMALLLISHDLGVIARQRAARAGDVRRHRGRERADARSVRAARRIRTRAGCSRPGRGSARARGKRLATIAGRVPELVDLPPGCPFADRCPIVIDACRPRCRRCCRPGRRTARAASVCARLRSCRREPPGRSEGERSRRTARSARVHQ